VHKKSVRSYEGYNEDILLKIAATCLKILLNKNMIKIIEIIFTL